MDSKQSLKDTPQSNEDLIEFLFIKKTNSGTTFSFGLFILGHLEVKSHILWENFNLPQILKKEMIAKTELIKILPSDPAEQFAYVNKVGAETAYHELCFGICFTLSTVSWASSSGILFLDRKTGVLINFYESFVGSKRFWVEKAVALIQSSSFTVTIITKRGGSFFTKIDDSTCQHLIYFNGVELIFFSVNWNKPPEMVYRIAWDPTTQKLKIDDKNISAFRVNTPSNMSVLVNGVLF